MLRNLANATSGEVDIIDIGDDGDDEDERMFIKSNTSSRSMKKLLSDVAVVVIFKDGRRSMRSMGGRIS
jgi:hypothetical protein